MPPETFRTEALRGYGGYGFTQGNMWTEITKGVGVIGSVITELANPAAAQAKRQQELELQQAIASGQYAQSQTMIEALRAKQGMWKWLIGGGVILGGGLIFAKVLQSRG